VNEQTLQASDLSNTICLTSTTFTRQFPFSIQMDDYIKMYAEVWATQVSEGCKFGAQQPTRYLAVRYEDLGDDWEGLPISRREVQPGNCREVLHPWLIWKTKRWPITRPRRSGVIFSQGNCGRLAQLSQWRNG